MLTEVACKNAQPGPKNRKLADAKGLYLLITPSGHKSWRWKYRFAGKEKKLVIGPYPEIKLSKAREACEAARAMQRGGQDPAVEKQRQKALAVVAALDSLEVAAREWHKGRKKVLTPRYADQVLSRLEQNVFGPVGALPVRQVNRAMVLALLRTIEARGAIEMASKVRMHLSEFFDWAVDSGLADENPADRVRKALQPKASRLRPAQIKLEAARQVLATTEAMPDVYWATRLASRMLALTAARPGVVRMAQRGEFSDLDGPAPTWRIPAAKMKLKRDRKLDSSFDFEIPLSRQAVATVRAAMATSPPCSDWLFPGIGDRRKPISDSTLSKHYRLAGLTGDHVPHGWRAAFSTIMNEEAARDDRERDRAIIDMMLAHMKEGVEAAYNRAAYMPRRRELAQAWADMLMEGLPEPSSLVAHLTS